jgi:methyltransferase (TIGR00027 family)
VIIGAGLDTRPYRLAHRCSIPVYEVDLPGNIARKRAAARRAVGGLPATVHLVPADLETDDFWEALIAHGFRPDQRTFFIWEGVTQYLTADAVRGVMTRLRHAAPGSRLVFTYVRDDFIRGVELHGAHLLYRRFRERREVWRFGMQPNAVAGFLAEYGWHMVEQAGPDYLEHHYVRPTGRGLTASQVEWSVYAEKR